MDTKTVNTFKKDTFKKDWGWKDVVRSFKKKQKKTPKNSTVLQNSEEQSDPSHYTFKCHEKC